MYDIVSEWTAQALSQISEGHDIGNDSLVEGSVPETTIPIGNGILGEIDRIEQTRQDSQREPVDTDNNLPPNTFGGVFSPVGTPEELVLTCTLLRDGEAVIVNDELTDRNNQVYHVIVRSNGLLNSYWVNEYWHTQLFTAADNYSGVPTTADDSREGVTLNPEEEAMLEVALVEEHHEIPENSATITVDETTSRFSGAIWYEQIKKQTITLAGVGGIGSYCNFLLARMKPERIIIYDPDKVEAVNMSGQLYGKNDLGSYKGVAIANMVKNYADYYNMVIHTERFTTESEATDIMICGFDNMEARKVYYNKWKSHISGKTEEEKAKCLFIDGRLAAEEFQVLSIQGNDNRAMAEYEDKWLFNDAEAEQTICSYKQTTFMANMIASVMVNVFVNFIANQCGPIIDRDVPFFISYDASTMFTKVVM